ncbi:hypothetical protein QAD02_008234 [Eretmocerus hayati]|uniref:Uncharacterized protein n=1 Tax=Eretmocerus hayati TaxID=131215 RepID=A0ACC2N5Z4_9HYME|nr:hypothetical protein QAD02_008234 [Eretmocerus hayati]
MSDVLPKISAEVGNSSSKVFDTDNAGTKSQSAVRGPSGKPLPVARMSPRVTRSRSQTMPPPPSLPVKKTMSTTSSSIGSTNDHFKLAGQEKESKIEKTLKRIKTTPSEALRAELITRDDLTDFIASEDGHSNLFEVASSYTDTIPSLVEQLKSAYSQFTHRNLKNCLNKIVKRLTIDKDSTSQ